VGEDQPAAGQADREEERQPDNRGEGAERAGRRVVATPGLPAPRRQHHEEGGGAECQELVDLAHLDQRPARIEDVGHQPGDHT
jgi:hypothetical protein